MALTNFWDNVESAQKVVSQLKILKATVEPVEKALEHSEELSLLWEMAQEENDQDTQTEVAESLEKFRTEVDKIELASLLSDPLDPLDCFFSIHAGAGGTESCDWADMLLRMYLRYFERNGYKAEEIS